MKLADCYMCDIDGCSSTNDSCLVVYIESLEMDLCEYHLYLVPKILQSMKETNLEND